MNIQNTPDKLRALRRPLIALLLAAMALPVLAFRMVQQPAVGRTVAGFAVPCNHPGGFTHWDTREIFWRRNVQGFGANTINALFRARVEWGANSNFILRDGGNTGAGFATDNINTTIWANNGLCVNPCQAITALVLDPGQVIVESDILFRADGVRWRTDGRDRRRDVDVQSTATHEFGHSLGIHHTEIAGNRATMQANYEDRRIDGRTLENDDRDAIACIEAQFPVAPDPGCTGPPATPQFISGPNFNHPQWATRQYTTNNVADADRYRWEVVGTPFVSTSTAPSVWLTANFGSGFFTMRVRAENDCGNSPWRTNFLRIAP